MKKPPLLHAALGRALLLFIGACLSLVGIQSVLAQTSSATPNNPQEAARAKGVLEEAERRRQEYLASPFSPDYASRIGAAIKPNVVYTADIAGVNPVEVEIRTVADGSIIQTRIVKASGTRDWDEAVVRAIQRTARLPLDVDGRVPPVIIFSMSPTKLR